MSRTLLYRREEPFTVLVDVVVEHLGVPPHRLEVVVPVAAQHLVERPEPVALLLQRLLASYRLSHVDVAFDPAAGDQPLLNREGSSGRASAPRGPRPEGRDR